MPKLAIAFAGTAESEYENVHDLLNDHLGMGPEDADGFPIWPENLDLFVILPADKGYIKGGMKAVLDYLEAIDSTYHAVTTSGKHSTLVQGVLDDADEVAEVTDVRQGLIDALLEAQRDGFDPQLHLLWGPDGGGEDAEVILDRALSAGIPVFDLAAGLDDIVFDEPAAEEKPEPEQEPEPERPKRGRKRADVEAEATKAEKPARGSRRKKATEEQFEVVDKATALEDLQTDVLAAQQEHDGGLDPKAVKAVLSDVLDLLQKADEQNAIYNCASEVLYRPLTKRVRSALAYLSLPPENASQEPQEPPTEASSPSPGRRGRPRATAASKPRTVKEKM